MHLAYLDDSDTKQKSVKLQVMAGVIVDDKWFKQLEINMRAIRSFLIPLIPADKADSFAEFHACELYGGYGVFDGVEQPARFDTIKRILRLLELSGSSVVYGAVDITKAKWQVSGSADALDIAFRICLQKVQAVAARWATRLMTKPEDIETEAVFQTWLEESVLLIVDDCEKKQRDMLQTSFRTLRHPPQSVAEDAPRMRHFHDDIYFGDSRYSIGIQLADLCSYFISRHLQGHAEIEGFYGMIEPHITSGELYPDGKQFRRSLLQQVLEARPDNEQQGVRQLRQDNAETDPDTTRQAEGGTGSGETGKGEAEV